jgi:hypothetical protein
VIVLAQLRGIASILVGDPLLGRRRVVHPGADVEVAIVEHQPQIGALGGRLAGGRHHLDEIAERLVVGVHRVVEPAIDLEWSLQLDRAHRGLTAGVAGNGRGGGRGGRTVDGDADRR